MRRLLLAGMVAGASVVHVATGSHDPFEFFYPSVSLTAADREHLDAGEAVVRVLPARGGELAVFAATRLDADPQALVDWTRAIETLKRGPYVPAIGRFSVPPVPEDLAGLTLEPDDLESIRRCRPGDCGVKLAIDEISGVRLAMSSSLDWRAAVEQEFRRLLVERVRAYQPEPLDSLLMGLPPVEGELLDSLFYWSKEQYGAGKPVIAITHVQIVRPLSPAAPEVLVVSRQVFASHYRNASVGLSAVVGTWPDGPRYLVYLNRSELDLLGGLFGGLKRKLIEGRFRSEAAAALISTRARLEGPPPIAH